MEVRLQKNGPRIGSPEQILHSFSCDTQSRQAQWEHRLSETPSVFREVQLEIQQHFAQGAELLTASLLPRVMQRPETKSYVQRGRWREKPGLSGIPGSPISG